MDALLARNAAKTPVKPRDPRGPDDAFAQLRTSITRLQAGTNRLCQSLKRFKNTPEEIEHYIEAEKLYSLLPFIEFAAEKSTALVNAMDRVKKVVATATVALAAMKMRRRMTARKSQIAQQGDAEASSDLGAFAAMVSSKRNSKT